MLLLLDDGRQEKEFLFVKEQRSVMVKMKKPSEDKISKRQIIQSQRANPKVFQPPLLDTEKNLKANSEQKNVCVCLVKVI